MTISQARHLIEGGVREPGGTWADIGAGTGTFTLALRDVLRYGTIYAFDKSPHVLWSLKSGGAVGIEVVEGDFHRPMELPMLDGIIMANALHYAQRPPEVLKNVLEHLKPGGAFLLIEYETRDPRPPWVPYPLPFATFQQMAPEAGLTEPELLAKVPSQYGHEHIYSAFCRKA